MSVEPWNPLEARMARLEGSYEQIDKRLSNVEGQVSELRGDIRTFRAEVETKFDEMRRESRQQFSWLLGVVILGVVLPVVVQIVTN